MKIEELVADLELCKRIPEGLFEDSAFCWQLIGSAGAVLARGDKRGINWNRIAFC